MSEVTPFISAEEYAFALRQIDLQPLQLDILRVLYAFPGHSGRALEIGRELGLHYLRVNRLFGGLGHDVARVLGIENEVQRTGRNGDPEWWSCLADGEATKTGFIWTLKPALIETLEAAGLVELKDFQFPEEVDDEEAKTFREGSVCTITVNAYERNPKARAECIRHYGARCSVCDFDFEEHYGDAAKGFIHVHHLRPLAQVRESTEVDPVNDMRPVCPNCHAVIHRRNPPYTLEEVKAMLARQSARGD